MPPSFLPPQSLAPFCVDRENVDDVQKKSRRDTISPLATTTTAGRRDVVVVVPRTQNKYVCHSARASPLCQCGPARWRARRRRAPEGAVYERRSDHRQGFTSGPLHRIQTVAGCHVAGDLQCYTDSCEPKTRTTIAINTACLLQSGASRIRSLQHAGFNRETEYVHKLSIIDRTLSTRLLCTRPRSTEPVRSTRSVTHMLLSSVWYVVWRRFLCVH